MVEPHPHNVRILLTAGQLLFVLDHVMCVHVCVCVCVCVRAGAHVRVHVCKYVSMSVSVCIYI